MVPQLALKLTTAVAQQGNRVQPSFIHTVFLISLLAVPV